eukprot:GHRQ01005457.1.p1 GENE.GHRQ01005457.1~~GHRQ01005457.1.p1  ORF type:complete len:258 (+),score=35.48 GHRQ01005457.1:82-774(+)
MDDVPCLPVSVVLSILQLLPQEAFVARLLSKSCRDVFDRHRSIQANYADLPHWVLREFYSSLKSDFERKQLLTTRAGQGDVQGVEWLLQQGASAGPSVSWAAAAGGHTHVLALLAALKPRCAFDETTCKAAAATGQLQTLRWLRSLQPEPCPWNASICEAAAAGGHIEVLQWCRAQHPACPFDEWACCAAAEAGSIAALAWLRSQAPPCPWNGLTCAAAAGGVRPLSGRF